MPQASSPLPYRVGRWLPSDRAHLDAWLTVLVEEVRSREAQPLHPVIEEFHELIEGDPRLYMFFERMFEVAAERHATDPTGRPAVNGYPEMLRLVNEILTRPPEFNESHLVGFPINAILDYAMDTPAGYAAFLDPRVNAQLKRVLDAWGTFLKSPDSTGTLTDAENGWFGPAAREAMPRFAEEFVCDPGAPHHGFTSWDDFFTRRFRPGLREVADPGDDAVIVNACESAPFNHVTDAAARDRFWIKSQPYSLVHLLDHDPLARHFVGGTVYQAFLSAFSYHRWHSPVSGRIVKTRLIEGTYYAEALSEGADPSGPNRSQGYIAELATRGLIFIEADNPAIGLMCFVAIGMAEVSTCDITVYEGQRVAKGQETGMFHFGGSTHCLLFRPGVELDFDFHGQTPGLDNRNIPVNARIATVR